MQIETSGFYLKKLSEILDGECFLALFNERKLMMKLYSSDNYITEHGYRAVELSTGREWDDLIDSDVVPVHAKVVIGD